MFDLFKYCCRRAKGMVPTFAVLAGLALAPGAGAAATEAKFVADELLVKGKAGVSAAQLARQLQGVGASELEELPQLQVKRIRVPEQARDRVKAALAGNPAIEFVEENFIAQGAAVPNDPGYASQWHHPRIAAPQGWDLATGSSNVVIAILDSGIDPAHPDLAGKLLPGYNFVSGNTDTHDVRGHGTAVAGSAAAIGNNARGVTGVAWSNPLMPLLVLDASNYATYSNIAAAIVYAADHGAKVLNISIAGSSSSSTLQNAVNYAWNKGAVVIAAAANYSTSTPYYPAACSNVVAVGATTSSDSLASFSNYGAWVDVTAPGVSIYTTNNGGGYGAWSGTSFSSPITAGLAGLVWAANPALTNAELVDILTQSADDLGTAGFDTTFGHGRINVNQALTLARSNIPVIDAAPPTVAITAPAAGATVTGQVNVNISASDDVKVTRVELFIDGVPAGSSASSPATFAWDTATRPDGWCTLTATASDAAGNIGGALAITVYVSNPTPVLDPEPVQDTEPVPDPEPAQDLEAPVVAITSPSPGAQLASSTTVKAQASDNIGIVSLELYVDGVLKAKSSAGTLSWKWNTRKVTAGAHTLTATAYDAAGNAASDSFTVYK